MVDSETRNANVNRAVGSVVLLWLAVVLALGSRGAFVRAPGALPLPIVVGVLAPILAFLFALRAIGPFRAACLSLDLPLAAGIQAWRLGGLGFLALYAYGVLPGLFAWPAGLGDMAIGATAPWVVLALRRQPAFAAGPLFRAWNLLGILDLVVAVTLGGLSSVLGIGLSEAVPTFPMAQMPLVLIPAFLVPLFVMLHVAALLQAQEMTATARACRWTEPELRCGPVDAMHGA